MYDLFIMYFRSLCFASEYVDGSVQGCSNPITNALLMHCSYCSLALKPSEYFGIKMEPPDNTVYCDTILHRV